MPIPPYYALVSQYGQQFGVDPKLGEAVLERESGGDPRATSPAGARGLMQIMPATGAGLGSAFSSPHPDLYDPNTNVKLGMYYLSQLLRQFHGNRTDAIAGYNAGAGAVEKYHGTPPYAETQRYVKNVEQSYEELGGKSPEDGLNWDVLSPNQHRDAFMRAAGPYVTKTFLASLEQALGTAKPWETVWDLFHKGQSYYGNKPKP